MKFESTDAAKRARVVLEHMHEIGARFCWATEHTRENGTDKPFAVRLELWMTRKGAEYIVQQWPDGGWNVFAPVDQGNDSLATLSKVV